MSSIPESPIATECQLELNGKQKTLHDVILHKDEILAQMYLGALYVFNQKQNPDYLPLAAHGVRELLEKLPKIVGVTPQIPDFNNRCEQLTKQWEKCALKSDCYSGEVFSGAVDKKLHQFLDSAKEFYEWFRGRPNRRDERTDTIRALDMAPFKMPVIIEKIRTDELNIYAKYFTGVSHHSIRTTEEEFSAHLNQLENFILDFLSPRTFEDHSDIDDLIKAGENNAK